MDELAFSSDDMQDSGWRAQLDRVIDAIADGVLIINREGVFEFANTAAAEILGVPSNEIVGRTFTDPGWKRHLADGSLVPPEDVPQAKVLATGEAVRGMEYSIERADESSLDVSVSASPIHGGSGEIVAVVAIFTDITERKRAEEALRQTRDHLQSLLDHANAPIITWNPSQEITGFNHAFEQMTGRAADEVIGEHLRILFPDDTRKESLAKIERTSGGEHWESVEIPILRADGQVRIALWNSGNILASDKVTVMATIAQGQDITERKKAEETLRDSEERLSGFMSSATDSCTIWDSSLNLVDLNQAALKYAPPGTRREDLIGQNLRVLEPDAEPSGRLDELRKVVETGKPFSIERLALRLPFEGVAQDRYLHVRAFKVGEGLGLMTTDITDRKRAEEALRESEERFRTMIEHSNDLIWMLDMEGKFTYFNRKAEEVSGYEARDWVGKSFGPMLAQEDLPRIRHVFMEVLAGHPQSYEVDVRKKDGSLFTLSANSASIYQGGEMVGTVSFGRDITEERRTRQALEHSEERYRLFLQNFRGLAFQTSIEERQVVFFHGAVEEITGYTEDEFIGGAVRWEQLVHPDDTHMLADGATKIRSVAGYVSEQEYRLIRKDGQVRWVRAILQNIWDKSGRPVTIQGTIFDITERRRTEEALRDSEERYRLLFESNPLPMWVYDLGTLRFLAVNQAAVEHYGYSRDEFLAMTIADIRPTEDVAGTWRHIKKDGTTIDVSITSYALDFGGRKAELVLANDVTELKKAEAELKQKDLAIRQAYVDVIGAVTGNRLVLVTPDEADEMRGEKITERFRVKAYKELSAARAHVRQTLQDFFPHIETADEFIVAVCEALTNCVKHAGQGTYQIFRSGQCAQIFICDRGPGIDFANLPRATLVPGFSTQQSLGVGFTLMLDLSDRVLLSTQPGSTTVVLEISK